MQTYVCIIYHSVVNPSVWSDYSDGLMVEGLDDADNVLKLFTSSCVSAGRNCSLNTKYKFETGEQLLAKIDQTLDSLYTQPVPIFDLEVPAVATAANLRALLFRSMYSMASWPGLSEDLAAAFDGNFTGIVNRTQPRVSSEHVGKPDGSLFSTFAVTVSEEHIYGHCVSNGCLRYSVLT
jgi:hypothetical protein